ncbi:MAG: hypothetical protein CMJ49_03600, partial [Planctomycetaceae bacterium]|nr:hypothetical protein [Planctomycetaceae bacterium]
MVEVRFRVTVVMRPSTSIRFADVPANRHLIQHHHRLVAVITLVRHPFGHPPLVQLIRRLFIVRQLTQLLGRTHDRLA